MTRRRPATWTLFGGAALGPAVIALPLTDQFALPKLAFALLMSAALLASLDPAFVLRRWRTHPVPIAAAALLLALLALSTALADYPRQSVLGTYADYSGWLYYLPGVIAMFAAGALVRSIAALERLVSMLAIGAVPVLAYAAVQVADADPVSWDIDFGRRAFSTLGQPLVLGGYTATLLPLFAWLAMRRRGGERTFLSAEAALTFTILIATGTRGAYIGAMAGGVAAVLLVVGARGVSRRVPAGLAGVAMLAVVVVTLVAVTGALPARLRSTTTLGERADLWRGSVDMVADRPLTGWGPDQFATSYGPYRPSPERGAQSPYEAPAASPHNETLQIAVAGGVPALAAYATIWLAVAIAAIGMLRASIPPQRRGAVIALLAAMAAYLAQAQFSIPDPSLNVVVMTLLGALAGLAPARRGVVPAWSRRAPAPAIGRRIALGPGVAVAGVLVAVAGALVAADIVSTRGVDEVAISAQLRDAERARDINPLQARYYDDLAAARDSSSRDGVAPRDARVNALATYGRRLDRFGGVAATYLDAARIASRDRETLARMDAYLARALAVDPLNPGTPAVIDEIRRGAVR